ncbi:hypothetical protein RB195_011236 [Necator americanus]|uniref:Uncharacterized protein n=1 Tax=Necator americanus TaxID=51031 RepID=A0ABR1D1J0_NECAM
MVLYLLTRQKLAPNCEHIRSVKMIVIFSYLVSTTHAVGTFEALCTHPFFYGAGELKGMECEVSYPMDTLNDLKAYDLCATTSPFEHLRYVVELRGGFCLPFS